MSETHHYSTGNIPALDVSTSGTLDDWPIDATLNTKRERFSRIVKHSRRPFTDLLRSLAQTDPDFHQWIGGNIADAVEAGSELTDAQRFDERLLQLMSFYGNSDLDAAIDFHARAQKLCETHSNSLVRYERIGVSLRLTKKHLHNLVEQGARLHDIFPKEDINFPVENASLDTIASTIGRNNQDQATTVRAPLPEPIKRKFQRLSTSDDIERADAHWIDEINESPVRSLSFYTLPSTRIAFFPTGISFREGSEHQYVYSMSDMYHYFRVAGKTAFSPLSEHRQLAYFLPRHGYSNHYHSLVDKLPALFGYRLLGFSCPIYSTYELSETERYFAALMDIDPDSIRVDIKGEALAETGILPNVKELRSLFFQFCSQNRFTSSSLSNRIYIARTNAPSRVMENEPAVTSLFAEHGFDVVCLEDYSIEEQIAIAGNARILAGPHGAGLANMIFAKSGLGVLELIPDRYMTPLFAQLAIDCGHRYSVIMGKTDKAASDANDDLRWNTPLDRLQSVLADLDDQERRSAA